MKRQRRSKEGRSAVLCLLFLGFVMTAHGQSQPFVLKEGDPVPSFQVGAYNPHNEAGKVRLIVVFRTGDSDIEKKVFQALKKIAPTFLPREVSFVGIIGGDAAAAKKLAGQYGLTFPLLSDPESVAAVKLGVVAVPTTYLIDKAGVVVRQRPLFPKDYFQEVELHLKWLCGDITKEEMAKQMGNHETHLNEKEKKTMYNLNLARRLWKMGKKDLAAKTLEQLRRQYPDFGPALVQVGCWELLEKRYDKAMAVFQDCAGKMPKEPDPVLGIAVTYRMLGKTAEAQQTLQKYGETAGKKCRYSYELARLNQSESSAVELYKKGIECMLQEKAAPASLKLHQKGVELEKAGNLLQAGKYYRRALETYLDNNKELIPLPDPLLEKLE